MSRGQPEGREPEKLIPLHGGYRKLKSFQVAQLAYDVTVRFCDRYIENRSHALAALLPKPAAARLVEAQA